MLTYSPKQLKTPWRQNQKFSTVVARVRHLFPSWTRWICSSPCHPVSLRFILIPSSHLRLGLPSGLFPSGFPTKTVYTFLSYPCMPHASPTSVCLIWSTWWDFGMRIDYGASLCACFSILSSPVTSPLLARNILLSTLFSTPSVYALPLMWETKFHTHTKQLQNCGSVYLNF
jgi:hypothetical protein